MSMTFKTSDFPTTVTLLLLRHQIVDVDRSTPSRVIFEFENTKELQQHVEQMHIGTLKVDPVDFWQASKRCKQMIYEGGLL